jgi:hypothetical protein
VTPALKLRMGIHAMVRFTTRVAALAAMAALLLQSACAMDFGGVTHLVTTIPVDSGCHESAPATPNTPDPGHICCAGDHSADALLTATYINALPMVSQTSQSPIVLTAPALFIPAPELPSLSPPGTVVLRI